MFLFLALIFILPSYLLYLNWKTLAPNEDSKISKNTPLPGEPTLMSHTPVFSPHATRRVSGIPEQSQQSEQGGATDEESSPEKHEEISPESITIAIFCALVYEAVAVKHMLDEEYSCCPRAVGPIKYVYSFGRIKNHKIVIAQPHQMGTVAAAHCATAVSQQFPNVRFALMVGIGAGIPNLPKHDIRLGDIAVSIPQGTHAGVIQYDFGKYEREGFVLKGCLTKPPPILISADNWLAGEELMDRSPIERTLRRITKISKFSAPDTTDILYDKDFDHVTKGYDCVACESSNKRKVVSRPVRATRQPVVHRGLILSGNSVIKNPQDRDQLRRYKDAICFEMEAAGIMDEIPCLIVRGICDYADTHKQDGWHYYAAAVAAAYCRVLLRKIDGQGVAETDSRLVKGVESLMKIATETRDAQVVSNQTTKYIEQTLELRELKIAQGAAFDSYENQHEQCLPGTRVELLRGLEEWSILQGGKYIFWLNGKAGTGKSTISRTVASRLSEKGLLGASFFFKRGEEDQGSARKLFPTLIAQLVNSIPQLRPCIQKAIKDDPQISEKVLSEQFKKLLLQPLLDMDHGLTTTVTRVIVIDALDECEQETDIQLILKLLPQVKESSIFQLRFLLTSRPELPIRLGFQGIADVHQDLILHEIPMGIIERDISLFLQHRIHEVKKKLIKRRCELPPDWPGNQHIATLVTMSVPLFIFAATVCRILEDPQWHPADSLKEILSHQNDKSNLDGTYLPVLNRLLVNQNGTRKLKLIREYQMLIGIILILKTPLPASSLSRLADIPKESISIRLDLLHSVLSVPDDETKPVRLFHLSFRDFLLDLDTRDKTPLWIDEKEIHGALTDRCFELMSCSLCKNICKLPCDSTQRSEINLRSVDQNLPPELQYACRYWAQHLVQSPDPVIKLLKGFSFLNIHFLHWVEAMSVLGLITEVVGVIKRLQSVIQVSVGELTVLMNAEVQRMDILKYQSSLTIQSDISLKIDS
ncbi:purine and uridine phosphorylase [Aspergillus alliaceus]|uniref:purine and uridine phosphorylase n=1 Tax=Petromyces alliaceus TaxID=209559 RepID=UPI0012A53B2D|nr:purine and uridine phosphorylase [Aspergillus alliaceus]KAB8236407.1 purine and uridine phosphorylase [Aspergillus alliaceus]